MSEVRIANLNTRVKSNYILSLSYSFSSSLIFLCCPNLDISICRYLIIPCYIYLKRHPQRYPFKYPLNYLRHFRALLEYAGVVWCLRLVRNQNLLYIIRPRLQFANFQHLRMSIMRGPDSDFQNTDIQLKKNVSDRFLLNTDYRLRGPEPKLKKVPQSL